MRRLLQGLALALAMLGGLVCVPTIQNGYYSCEEADAECPDGWVCRGFLCYAEEPRCNRPCGDFDGDGTFDGRDVDGLAEFLDADSFFPDPCALAAADVYPDGYLWWSDYSVMLWLLDLPEGAPARATCGACGCGRFCEGCVSVCGDADGDGQYQPNSDHAEAVRLIDAPELVECACLFHAVDAAADLDDYGTLSEADADAILSGQVECDD